MAPTRFSRTLLLSTSALIGAAAFPAWAAAQPAPNTVPVVTGNPADVSGAVIGAPAVDPGTGRNTLPVVVVNQRAVIDWASFSIGSNGEIQFTNPVPGPNPDRAVLNRDLSGGMSEIYGFLTADPNISVFVLNPNGVLFGPSATVNVGGLIASNLAVSDPDFLDGDPNFTFMAAGNGPVATLGGAAINAGPGTIAFLGSRVDVAAGSTLTSSGDVALVAAHDVTLSLNPGSPLAMTINQGTPVQDALVVGGAVEGRNIYLAVATQGSVTNAVLNASGTLEATGATATDRGVVLTGGRSGSGVTVATGGGNDTSGDVSIAVNGTVTSAADIELRASRNVTINTALVAPAAEQINISGGAATGTVLYNGATQLTADTNIDAANVRFAGTVDSTAGADLTITAASSTRFDQAVGAGAVLGSVTVNGPGPTTISGGAVRTSGGQSYAAVNLVGDTELSSTGNGDIRLNGAVNSLSGLTVNTGGDTRFGGVTSVRSLATGLGGTTTIAGGTVLTTSTQSYGDAVVLEADTATTSTGTGAAGNITFGGTVNGAHVLTVETAGTTRFNGAVGGVTALRELNTVGGGSAIISGGSVRTAERQTYNNTLIFGADTTLTSTGVGAAGNIWLLGPVGGVGANVTINTAGETRFASTASLASLTTDMAGSTRIAGGSILTSGNQSYGDPVQIDAATALTGANLTFGGAVNGNHLLVTNSPGITRFNGAVTVASLNTASGLADPSLGVVQIAGGGVTTTGAQIYANDVVLAAAALLSSTGGGDISFGDFVDGAFALTVTTSGTTTFFSRVGATDALASLTVNGGGATRLAGLSVNTTGNQTYTDDLLLTGNLTLTGGTPTFGGDVTGDGSSLTLDFSGETRISGTGDADPTDFTNIGALQTGGGGTTVLSGLIATIGSQTYLDDLRLAAATTLRGTNGVFTNLDGNGQDLILEFAGTVALTPAVINVANLTSRNGGTTTVTGALTTTGSQTFDDNLVLLGDTVLASSGNADILLSRVTGAFDLTVTTGGVTRLTGVIGGGAGSLDMLSITPGGSTLITGGAITTTGDQTYGDDVQLGADTFIASGAGNITFAGTVASSGGDRALTIDSQGDISFNGAVGTLAALNITAGGGPGGAIFIAGGGVTTSGGQNYAQRVVLTADAVLASTASGAIALSGVVEGPGGLTVNTAGVTSFFQSVGTPGAALAFLRTDAPGETHISGVSVRTIGNQDYLDTLRLLAPTITLQGATPTFGGRVIGNGTALTLTFTGDTRIVGTLPGNIANFTGFTSLTTNGGGRTLLSGLLNIANQSYFDMVVLAGDTTLMGVNPLFGATVDGNGFDLTLDFSGTTTLSGVDDGNPLDFVNIDDLTVGNGGTTELSGRIATTGRQTYGDPVTLLDATRLQSSGAGAAGDVGFGGTVDGGFALTVTTAGTITFAGAVGGTSPLAALTINGGGATRLDGGRVATTGDQLYGGLLSLGADTLLSGATPTFQGSVVGNGNDLTLTFSGETRISGTGDASAVDFTGLDDLVSNGGGATILSGAITTTGTQDYADAVRLAGGTTLTSTGNLDVVFRAALDSNPAGSALAVVTGGVTCFQGQVGAAGQLGGLTTDAAGSTELRFDINSRSTTIADPLLLVGDGLQRIMGGAVTLAQVTGLLNNDGLLVDTARPGGFDAAVFNGAVRVTNLGVSAETVAFNATDNDVDVLAVITNSSGFSFSDTDDLTVNFVDFVGGIATPGAASNLVLIAGGLLTVSDLISVGGTINISATGVTTTAGMRAGLDGPNGAILVDANDGNVTLGAPLTTTASGANAIRLIDATNVSLADVSTGAGGTLTLGIAGDDRITGNVSQLAGTRIDVGVLTGVVGGSVLLTNVNNLVGALSAFSAANLSVRDNAGGLLVTGDVNVSGQLLLSVNGTLNQTGGTIVAGDLFANTAGGVSLERPGNRIAIVSGLSNAGAGGIRLNNAIALRIRDSIAGNIIVDAGAGALQIDAPGLNFTDEVLRAGANLTLVGQTGAVVGDALRAGGNVTVTGATIDVNSALGATGGDSRAALVTMTAANGALRLGTARSASDIILGATGGNLTLTTGDALRNILLTGNLLVIGSSWAAGERTEAAGASGVLVGTASGASLLLTSSGGGVDLGTGAAVGSATVTAATDARIAALTSTTGDIAVTAGGAVTGQQQSDMSFGRTDLSATGAEGDVTVAAGTLARLGTVRAGRDVDVRAGAATGAGATAISIDATTITGRDVALRTDRGGIRLDTVRGRDDVVILANSSQASGNGDVTVSVVASAGTAADGADLGSGSNAAGVADTLAGSVAEEAGFTRNLADGSDLLISATGTLNLMAGLAIGDDIDLIANRISLGNDGTGIAQTQAARIELVNRTAGGSVNLTVFGGTGDDAGAFMLNASEVNLLNADVVNLFSGAQPVEIRAVALSANVGDINLRLLGTGRFDVIGSLQGSTASRTLQIGGVIGDPNPNAAGAMADRIVIRPTVGGGGRILLSAGRLDLRGQRIAAGLDPSADATPQQNLLSEIGILTGAPDATSEVAGNFVSNPNSSLYFEQTLIGTGDAAVFLRADRLTVTYSEYALFQNTAFQNGLSAGVVLDSRTAGGLALDINTTGREALNAFALFGSINDARASAAAVLGATAIDASNVNPANSRINGCLISSAGGGCLITAINPPRVEAVREDLINIITADEAALQVDPLVGTSNEALLTDCESDPGAEQCPAEERP